MMTLPEQRQATADTTAADSALWGRNERDREVNLLAAARAAFDRQLATMYSADNLTRYGLWINLHEYLTNPVSRAAFDRSRQRFGALLFGDTAQFWKDNIQKQDIAAVSANPVGQELQMLRQYSPYIAQITNALNKSQQKTADAHNNPFYASLITFRIYAELFDMGMYMLYSFTDDISNIHIIGTRMFCYRNDGSVWFAVLPAARTPEEIAGLASYYARRVGKRFDLGFPHNNLDTTRQHRVAVRQKTVQFDTFTAAIRLHKSVHPRASDMVDYGFLSIEAMNFCQRCVFAALPGLITGAPGSGKTTFLRALALSIPREDPIFSVEYAPELFLHTITDSLGLPYFICLHAHVVQGANAEGSGAIPFHEIFQWGLQEDVRRFIIGELADPESMLTFINALQTGQSGALATLHANSVEDTVSRVTSMLSATYDREIAWEYLRQNLRFIVHAQLSRTSEGESRTVSGIGWLDYKPNDVAVADQPPIIHSVYRRDFARGILVRGPGWEEAMRQLCDAEDRALGKNLGMDLSADRLYDFGNEAHVVGELI